ncbi:hypothetical protein GCM10027258_62560 [Amycolatopsis stemonae]
MTRVDLETTERDALRRTDATEITVTIRTLDGKPGAYTYTRLVSRELMHTPRGTPALEEVALQAVREITEHVAREYVPADFMREVHETIDKFETEHRDQRRRRLQEYEGRWTPAEPDDLDRG